MNRRILGPFNRVEGDLEVRIDIADQQVSNAWVVSPLYRGYEQILQGKDPLDALVYVPRICGICSVAQSVAAAQALAQAQNIQPTPNGNLATKLILANENLADHLTHFYLFFMPDFARPVYANESWFPTAEARFKAVSGSATQAMLPKRAEFMHVLGMLAGKWPHSLALQPGGTTRALETHEISRVQTLIFSCRRFLEQTLFGDTLETVIALDSAHALEQWRHAKPDFGDLRHFLDIADALALHKLGRASDRFMSYGAYGNGQDFLFARGVYEQDQHVPLNEQHISEDVSHSWMQSDSPRHPFEGVTLPDAIQPLGYSWCKAPRLEQKVIEVGALARQVVDGHPLLLDLVQREGGNVRTRVIARLLEVARILVAMEQWAVQLKARDPFCHQGRLPEEAEGMGLIEAARGSLGHWLKIRKGRIYNYQIIAPTTWNFSPRDQNGIPGALEQALLGAPIRQGEQDPVSVQHIVRSFDPCMVCTVH